MFDFMDQKQTSKNSLVYTQITPNIFRLLIGVEFPVAIVHTGRKLTNASSVLHGMFSDQSKTTKKQNKIAPHISFSSKPERQEKISILKIISIRYTCPVKLLSHKRGENIRSTSNHRITESQKC